MQTTLRSGKRKDDEIVAGTLVRWLDPRNPKNRNFEDPDIHREFTALNIPSVLVSYLAYSDYVIILFSLDSYCVLVFQQDS